MQFNTIECLYQCFLSGRSRELCATDIVGQFVADLGPTTAVFRAEFYYTINGFT